MDFLEGLKYSFSALKEKKLYPDYIIFMVLCAFFYLCMYAFPSLSLLFIIPFALVLWYFVGKFIHYRLSAEKLATGKYSQGAYLKYMSAIVAQMLHVLFFWREKRALLLYLVPIVGAIFLFSSLNANAGISASSPALKAKISLEGALPGLLLIIAGLLAILIAYTFHSYRLCFMPLIKLCSPQKDLGFCSQSSWSATHKKFLTIFAYVLGFTICIGIPIALISCAFAFLSHDLRILRILDGVLSVPFYCTYAFLLVYIYKSMKAGKTQPENGKKRAKKCKKAKRR